MPKECAGAGSYQRQLIATVLGSVHSPGMPAAVNTTSIVAAEIVTWETAVLSLAVVEAAGVNGLLFALVPACAKLIETPGTG